MVVARVWPLLVTVSRKLVGWSNQFLVPPPHPEQKSKYHLWFKRHLLSLSLGGWASSLGNTQALHFRLHTQGSLLVPRWLPEAVGAGTGGPETTLLTLVPPISFVVPSWLWVR
jgi:hypothetical protein